MNIKITDNKQFLIKKCFNLLLGECSLILQKVTSVLCVIKGENTKETR